MPETPLRFSNVHYFAAGASLFGDEAQGAYQYADKEYVGRNMHAPGFQTCTDCHSTHHAGAGVRQVRDLPCRRRDACRISASARPTSTATRTSRKASSAEITALEEKLFAAMQTYAKDVAKKPILYDRSGVPVLLRRHECQRQD